MIRTVTRSLLALASVYLVFFPLTKAWAGTPAGAATGGSASTTLTAFTTLDVNATAFPVSTQSLPTGTSSPTLTQPITLAPTPTFTPAPSPTPATVCKPCARVKLYCGPLPPSAIGYPICHIYMPSSDCEALGLKTGVYRPQQLNAIDCNNLKAPDDYYQFSSRAASSETLSDEQKMEAVRACCALKEEVFHVLDPQCSVNANDTAANRACSERDGGSVSFYCLKDFAAQSCKWNPAGQLCVSACQETDKRYRGWAFDNCFCLAHINQQGQVGWDVCTKCHEQCVKQDPSSQLPPSCPNLAETTVPDPQSSGTTGFLPSVYKICDDMANKEGHVHTCSGYVTLEQTCSY